MGLAVAHERGLIHRDIKPANIWLEADRPSGRLKRVKILDFGLARPILNHNTLSNSGELVGTPNYMAPEQIFGRPLDGRTDLYSLGCTLYACLMGTPPFVKDDTTALLEAIAFENTPDLGKLEGRMPPPVAILLTEMLAKDPEARSGNGFDCGRQVQRAGNRRHADGARHFPNGASQGEFPQALAESLLPSSWWSLGRRNCNFRGYYCRHGHGISQLLGEWPGWRWRQTGR